MSEVGFKTKLMRQQGKKWTLGSDVELLNQLENFSQSLVHRTCSFLHDIDDIETDLQRTNLDIKTLSNNFEAVSNTQFVENRVYDEEEDISSFVQRKDESTSFALNVSKKVEEAIKTCANILDSKFEAVNIPVSDSEGDSDDGMNSEVIFIPKNKYKFRPLPHLIGSKDFYNDESLGLLFNTTYNGLENMSENIINGGDETESHSVSSCSDEPDESSVGPESNTSNYSDNEVNKLPYVKDSTVVANSGTEILHIKKNFVNTLLPEKLPSDHPFIEKTSPVVPNNLSSGATIKSSIQDELKQLFKGENNDEVVKPKLKSVLKPENSCSNKDCKSNILAPLHSDHKHILADDSMLPNVPTEILHSFAKERAKIKGKRRLPSRKPKNEEVGNNEGNNKIENPVLSPSTDEEDLFVLPKEAGIESSASSLFTRSSLFSPGSSIEQNFNNFFSDNCNIVTGSQDSNVQNYFDEPLGVNKDTSTNSKEGKMKNLFIDWDPFASEDSVLFQAPGRRNQKTNLFDGLGDSSNTISKINDEDLFTRKSTSSLSLFDSDSTFPNKMLDNPLIGVDHKQQDGHLFSEDSDEGSIFSSKEDTFNQSFLVSLDRRKDNRKLAGGSLQSIEEATRSKVHLNPLSDDLFD